MKLKDALRDKLTKRELVLVPRAFDIVGDVAIIEIPPGLGKRKKDIAHALKAIHPRIRTVCGKTGERKGDFRLHDLEILLGKSTKTEHRESGCRFMLDVRHTYFSGREGTERQRIAAQVKPGEKVLVMFSGVCPFPVVIAKKQPSVGMVYGVELNPKAHAYALENVRINRVQLRVRPVLGDVKDACKDLKTKFDRILMPLPKEAHLFLDVAFACAKPGGIVHFYHWDREDDPFTKAVKIVRQAAKKAGRKARILGKNKVLPYGPRIWKICIDFQVI